MKAPSTDPEKHVSVSPHDTHNPTNSSPDPSNRPSQVFPQSQDVEGHSSSDRRPHHSFRRTQSAPARPRPQDSGSRPPPKQLFQGLLEPQKSLRITPTWTRSLRNIATYSYVNVLLVFVPVAWAVHFAHVSDTIIFVMSMIGIIPLAGLLSFATEELADRVGHALGGIINATFGNAVELIVAILALTKGELRVVQSSMVGSILSNCLLVCGMCFTAGGLRFYEQHYDVRAAQLNISMLGISSLALAIPAVFHISLGVSKEADEDEDESILQLSRGTAFVLITLYACYLFYQFWTHAYLYQDDVSSPNDQVLPPSPGPQPPNGEGNVLRLPSWHLGSSSSSSSSSSESDDDEQPLLSGRAAVALLLIVTVIIGFTAEWLVSSIDGLTATGNITREFVALILLPLVGNASEHAVAVIVSVKGKLNLSLTVAIGSSIQIALLVLPFLILLAWCIGQPLSLYFDTFETVVLFMSMVIVNFAITDGRTNWLEGIVLMFVYVLIALASWFYPGKVGNEVT